MNAIALPPLLPAWPEIFLVVMTCVILLADLYLSDARRGVTFALSLMTLAGTLLLLLLTQSVSGGQPSFTFNDMFVADGMATVLKALATATVAVCLVYSRRYLQDRELYKGEFSVL